VVARRTSPPPAPLAPRTDSAKLAPWRNLTAGQEADVLFAGAKRRRRARFVSASPAGLTFADPRTGALRFVRPDDVGTIHKSRKLRSSQ
jgi:hypothetical protein